ncbi:porin [Piscinibacter sp.]|uniref:porin n=1 Tax=Piscinibacter sp. TaxID=1903157 RepID=UPI002C2FD226|nr:porin [Albitalea sp.]HUG20983.1 porin [Albitalea sp.]
MKKSLLALAVLGAFAGAATAQSSVTIYGSIDMSIAKQDGDAASPGAPGNEAWTLQQSNGSRLGFQGNEDLGGGLSAQFQIEHRYTPDNGNAANPFWAGRSYVQLSSATAGRVYMGREYTPAFWPAVKSDPFGWDGVGQMGSMQWAGYLSTGGVRAPNTIGYRSPNWGGFTVNAATGLGEGATSRADGFNVEYGAGPLYAAFGYEQQSNGPAVTDGNSLMNVALHYNVGFAKLIAYYAQAEISDGVNGGEVDSKAYMLAAAIPVGAGTIKAAYIEVIPDGSDNDRTKLGLGYNHPLSKRTTLYADYGFATQDTVSDSNTFALGIKHTF